MKKIGKITHYYGKIGVAIIKLDAPLKAGDVIKMKNAEGEFEQTVESMQIEHASVAKAGKGEEVGIKVEKKPSEGSVVYEVAE